MPYVLVLEDIRRLEGIKFVEKYELMEKVLATSYDEFLKIIYQRGLPEMVSLDHDLCSDHYIIGARNYFTHLRGYEKCPTKNGLDAAKFMVSYCEKHKEKLPVVYVHSQNPAGRQAILQLINQYKKKEQENGTKS